MRECSLESLQTLVNKIPARFAADYDSWCAVIWAIKNETGGSQEGLRLAHEFARKDASRYDGRAVDDLWAHSWDSDTATAASRPKYTRATLVYYARQGKPTLQANVRRAEPRQPLRLLAPAAAAKAQKTVFQCPVCPYTGTQHRRFHDHFVWEHLKNQRPAASHDMVPQVDDLDKCAVCRCRARGCDRNPCMCKNENKLT